MLRVYDVFSPPKPTLSMMQESACSLHKPTSKRTRTPTMIHILDWINLVHLLFLNAVLLCSFQSNPPQTFQSCLQSLCFMAQKGLTSLLSLLERLCFNQLEVLLPFQNTQGFLQRLFPTSSILLTLMTQLSRPSPSS